MHCFWINELLRLPSSSKVRVRKHGTTTGWEVTTTGRQVRGEPAIGNVVIRFAAFLLPQQFWDAQARLRLLAAHQQAGGVQSATGALTFSIPTIRGALRSWYVGPVLGGRS